MTVILRPNRDALDDALAIYRDAMRPFLVHHLRQIPGRRLEETIRISLQGNQAAQFDDNIRKGRSIEDSIDVSDFPALIRNNWRGVFSAVFPRDRVIQNRVSDIREIRNEISHPESTDLDAEKTRAHLYMIADVLGRINRPNAKVSVEEIRDRRLFGPPRTAEIAPPVPDATAEGKSTPADAAPPLPVSSPDSPACRRANSTTNAFPLRLGRTYYNQGFFNVSVDFDQYVRPDEGPVTLVLDGYGAISAKVNRTANSNRTARVMGGAGRERSLRDWFQRTCSIGDTVLVCFDSPFQMTLQK